MKLFITGASGQVGWELGRQSPELGFETEAKTRLELDITNREDVADLVIRVRPDVIINAAAYTAVDAAESEPESSDAVNRKAPEILAELARDMSIPLIHISTDYVFDGTKSTPYTESDPIKPVNAYGATKAAGEKAIRNTWRRHIIVRTSWVYGVHGRNFVKTMLNLARERETLRIVNDQSGCPTFAADLARALLEISRQVLQGNENWGTYHYCGKGRTTWYDFALKIFELAEDCFELKVKSVEPVPTTEYPTPAVRPMNSVMDCSRLAEAFGIYPPPWEESLKKMIQEWAKRSALD